MFFANFEEYGRANFGVQHFGLRNFRYIDTIKEAVERECHGVVSYSDILVLSARDGVVSLGGPYIPLKTGRRDGRKSRVGLLEEYLPDHNESITYVLDKFGAMGIDTPGVVSLLGAHSVGRTHCTKLVHRLYPEVDPALNPHQPVILHMLDIPPAAESLNGVKMELVDAAFPLLKGVVATTDVVEACTGVNVAVMVGGFQENKVWRGRM